MLEIERDTAAWTDSGSCQHGPTFWEVLLAKGRAAEKIAVRVISNVVGSLALYVGIGRNNRMPRNGGVSTIHRLVDTMLELGMVPAWYDRL